MIEKAPDADGELPPDEDVGAAGGAAGSGPPAGRRLPLQALAALEAVAAGGSDPASASDPASGEGAGPANGGEVLNGADATAVARPLLWRVEAALFASGQPLGATRLAHALGAETAAVAAALSELASRWSERDGAVDLVEIAGGFRFMTRPGFAPDVAALQRKATVERLSPAALETLAVVAYRQPITRADVEAVRGVAVGPLLRLLLERDLIRITGRASEPGHPLLYGTTKRFLDHFGLSSLDALPDLRDLLETP